LAVLGGVHPLAFSIGCMVVVLFGHFFRDLAFFLFLLCWA
jgi:hypothetical protein